MTEVGTSAPRIKRGPLLKEVAALAGVGTATVDRVLNNRSTVSEATRLKVLEALHGLQAPREVHKRRITFLCESGESFNRSLQETVSSVARRRPDLDLVTRVFASFAVQPPLFARLIEREAEYSDGIVLIARRDPNIIRAARAVRARGRPVICLATDLPRHCRDGFVGSNEVSAGAAAADLLGRLMPHGVGRVLLILCGHYRAALERETGFRQVLHLHYPGVDIQSRADVENEPREIYTVVKNFVAKHGRPHGIYSIAGGNSGVGRALVELAIDREVVFIGHELHASSRELLRQGVMDFVIAREQEQELSLSLGMIDAILSGRPFRSREETQVRIVSRHICG